MNNTINVFSIPLEVAPAVLCTIDNQIIEAVRANNYVLASSLLWNAKELREAMEVAHDESTKTEN